MDYNYGKRRAVSDGSIGVTGGVDFLREGSNTRISIESETNEFRLPA
jgi:hypothetical protein